MKTGRIDISSLSREDYWKYFRRIIFCADTGTIVATMAWIMFWLDHIPQHVIHTHFISGFGFLAALSLGLSGAWTMVSTGNRLGAANDRLSHLVKILYTLSSSVSGIWAYWVYPPP